MSCLSSPKVFISYSWSSTEHQIRVKEWADRLIAEGVDVIMDIYDLKEGNDKYHFMERMVNDPSVTHVLVICDGAYTEKANARKAGVGTESQIISKEVFDKVGQSKFIPVICELDDQGDSVAPVFLRSRIGIRFCSPEMVNENWEQLIRMLYGKPAFQKPSLGKPPIYISQDASAPPDIVVSKLRNFQQAFSNEKPGLARYRSEFLDACIEAADSLRVRVDPRLQEMGPKVVEDCGYLKIVRNHIVDWIAFEAPDSSSNTFQEVLIEFLERLRELKARPSELSSWNSNWFDAHVVFVYETFLYVIAALLKANAFTTLNELFSSHYLKADAELRSEEGYEAFDCFYGVANSLENHLTLNGSKFLSPTAELIKRQADRKDISFNDLIQAEMIAVFMTLIKPNMFWYPQTIVYWNGYGSFPFFIRAAQKKGFKRLSLITGVEDANLLRNQVKNALEKIKNLSWGYMRFRGNFWGLYNMDSLDSLR